jgi:hypothetical protein
MEGLTQLVKSLKPGEVQLVKHIYSLKNSPEKKKRDKLFNLIIIGKATSDESAIKLLYPDKSMSAFSQLKTRLRHDILNVLILQESTTKYKTPYAQATFDCRRALIQGEILLGRGIYSEAINILSKASKLAEKYELFAEKVLIDDLLRNHLVMKEGIKPFNECSESINRNISLLEKTLNAKCKHYEITVPSLFKANQEAKCTKNGKRILEEIKADYEETGAIKIGFYYYLAAMYYYSFVKNFEQALEYGTKLSALVQENKIVASASNIGGAQMELSNILINLGRYEQSSLHAETAMSKFKSGMINELYALEKLFFAHFRNGDLELAEKTLDKAFTHKRLKYSGLLNAKWTFLKAGLEFEKQNFETSFKLLRKNSALTKDKTGWLLGYCLLEVQNRIEKKKFDWVDYRYESFKKILQRYNKLNQENGNRRAAIILKIIRTLMRTGYCFKAVIEREKTNLELLAEGKDAYYWNPTGYEIIRFEQWVYSKAALLVDVNNEEFSLN